MLSKTQRCHSVLTRSVTIIKEILPLAQHLRRSSQEDRPPPILRKLHQCDKIRSSLYLPPETTNKTEKERKKERRGPKKKKTIKPKKPIPNPQKENHQREGGMLLLPTTLPQNLTERNVTMLTFSHCAQRPQAHDLG